MNVFLIGAIVLLAVQLGCLAVVATVGGRLSYYVHQAICEVGKLLWLPVVTLCLIGVAVA